jgi:hypothetical protein
LRDILTVLAVLVVLVLAAALGAPAFMSLEPYRQELDTRLSALMGEPVRTEGPLSLRLLPSPRLRLQVVSVGRDEPGVPTAHIRDVSIEAALLPLLRRDLQFTEITIGRADLSLVADEQGRLRGPWNVSEGGGGGWHTGIGRLALSSGEVRVLRADGTRRLTIPDIALVGEATNLTGPWRLVGHVAGFGAQIVTGEPQADGRLRAKIALGGNSAPRFEFDGLIGTRTEGALRILAGPPVQPMEAGLPIGAVLNGRMSGGVEGFDLTDLLIEIGEGTSALKINAQGRLDLSPTPRLTLNADSRFVDVDSFVLSTTGSTLLASLGIGGRSEGLHVPLPVDISFAASRLTVAGEEVGGLTLRLAADETGPQLRSLSAVLPGETRVSLDGEGRWGSDPTIRAKLDMSSREPTRLSAWLSRINVGNAPIGLSGGKPFTVTADIAANPQVIAASNLRWTSGEGSIGGLLRYSPGAGTAGRGLIEASLSASMLDVATLPALDGLRRGFTATDLRLAIDARDLRYGTNLRSGAGRLTSRIVVTRDTTTIEALDITELAGLTASVRGSLALNGDGEVGGRVRTNRLEPAIDLMAKLWGGQSLLAWLPPGLVSAPFEGEISLAADADDPARAVTAKIGGLSREAGIRGEAAFARAGSGAIDRFTSGFLTASGPKAPAVLALAGLPVPPGVTGPAEATATLSRRDSAGLNLSLAVQAPGLTLATRSPVELRFDAKGAARGQFALEAADLRPWLAAWQLPLLGRGDPLPTSLVLALGLKPGIVEIAPRGRVGPTEVRAELGLDMSQRIYWGEIETDRFSLPGLLGPLVFGLNLPAEARMTPPWDTRRFGQPTPPPATGDIVVRSRELLAGLQSPLADARVTVIVGRDRVVLKDVAGRLGPQEVGGTLTFLRQTGRISVTGEVSATNALAMLPGADQVLGGRWRSELRFGANGETATGLLTSLSGAGRIIWEEPSLPRIGATAPLRVAREALRRDDMPDAIGLSLALNEALGVSRPSPLGPQRRDMPVVLQAGVLKAGPVALEFDEGRLNTQVQLDLRDMSFEARLYGQAAESPRDWSGNPPAAGIVWRGPAAGPLRREIDAAPLLTALTAIKLGRELDRIEMLEQDARERAFFNRRLKSSRDTDWSLPAMPSFPPPQIPLAN